MKTLKADNSFVLCIFIVCVTVPGLLASQEDRFSAGLAAKERGHYATALRSWLPMAEAGNAEAQNNVGHMYEEGFGVSQNYSTAMPVSYTHLTLPTKA